jgi:hypothetical protein
MKRQTDGPQTGTIARLRALDAQEGSREQREESGATCAGNDGFGRNVLKRPGYGTSPVLAFQAEKNPTDKGWAFGKWWSRRESNPRPQVLYRAFYILSSVI